MIEHFKIISIEEFKESEFWDIEKENKNYLKPELISQAISMASSFADYISGNQISKDINLGTMKDENLNIIKQAVERQVQFLVRNGTEYMRASSMSISTGSYSYQTSNPSDPFYIVPEFFMLLRQSGYLITEMRANLYENEIKHDNTDEVEIGLRELDKRFVRTGPDGITSTDTSILVVSRTGGSFNAGQVDLAINWEQLSIKSFPYMWEYVVNSDEFKQWIKDTSKEIEDISVEMIEEELHKLMTDQGFMEQLGKLIEKFLQDDTKFQELLGEAMTKLITENGEWVIKTGDYLENNKEFIDIVSARVSENTQGATIGDLQKILDVLGDLELINVPNIDLSNKKPTDIATLNDVNLIWAAIGDYKNLKGNK